MISKILRLLIFLCVWECVIPGYGSQANTEASREYLIKAGFLFNFAKFVEWPAEAFPTEETPFVLCVYWKDPFGEIFETIQAKTVRGRKVRVLRCTDGADLPRCHILFVSRFEADGYDQVLSRVGDRPVLTVGETDGFVREGGIINLFTKENRVRFEINVREASRKGLSLSSKLLKLARIVEGQDR